MDKNEAQSKADELAKKIMKLCKYYGATIVTDDDGWIAVSVRYGPFCTDIAIADIDE